MDAIAIRVCGCPNGKEHWAWREGAGFGPRRGWVFAARWGSFGNLEELDELNVPHTPAAGIEPL
jgi:hypothetical protein